MEGNLFYGMVLKAGKPKKKIYIYNFGILCEIFPIIFDLERRIKKNMRF